MILSRISLAICLAFVSGWPALAASEGTVPQVPIRDMDMQAGECEESIELHQPQLSLHVEPATGMLTGDFQVTLVNPYTRPLSQACFVLNTGLTVENLEFEGLRELRREPPDREMPLAYRLIPEMPFAPGSRHLLQLRYWGKIAAQPKFGRIAPDNVFLTSQTFFYPRFERAYRRYCPMQVQAVLPEGYLPVLSGDRQMKQDGPIYAAEIETVCGLRNEQGFDLAAARYKVFETEKLHIYHHPDKLRPEQLQQLANEQLALIQTLGEQFGPHGIGRYQLVETNREDLGGMAKANTVFLSNKHFGDPKTVAPAQFDHFSKLPGGVAGVPAEFAFYRRGVLAHESAHLYVNHYYDLDKPWMTEGLPEFASLRALAAIGDKAGHDRKLADYRKTWAQIPNRPLPALNEARLEGQLHYLANYQGTPLLLWAMSQTRPDFWPRWRDWFADRSKPLSYEGFKSHFKLTPAEAARFETAFEPEGL